MMDSMIMDKRLTFKELEQKIFHETCATACIIMRKMLEDYDECLRVGRDKTAYRNKGRRTTTVKTVFGEVTFCRTVYQTENEDGTHRFVFLLDEALGLNTVGLFSELFVEKLVSGITTKSYRACAGELSETTAQGISATGVWNIVQALGEKLCREEKDLVEQHEKGLLKGEVEAPVVFEETDGVNLSLQGKDREESKSGKAEMKVAIAYDGWKAEGNNRYRLDKPVCFAGFAGSKEFHKAREAKIAQKYNLDEAGCRILNGDGAGWIKKVPDRDTLFQLDVFHRNKAVKEKLLQKKAQEDVLSLLWEGDVEGVFSYLETYRDSVTDEEETRLADELIMYFEKNRDGLLPYSRRGLEIPESPEGLVYREMGTMEGHVWGIVARRMKHNHTSWSKAGANSLAKILGKKFEGKLGEVAHKLEKPTFLEGDTEESLDEALGEMMSAAKAPTVDGKGYEYPRKGSFSAIYSARRGDSVKAFRMAGY